MRQFKAEIRKKLADYLVEALNSRAIESGLEPIRTIETSVTAVPGSSPANPSLFIYVGGRELSQSFFDTYSVQIGICYGCSTPQEGSDMADLWEDAVEDVFRCDRSFGDAAITWTGEPTVKSVGEANLWMTTCEFSIDYDLGGHTYEEE